MKKKKIPFLLTKTNPLKVRFNSRKTLQMENSLMLYYFNHIKAVCTV